MSRTSLVKFAAASAGLATAAAMSFAVTSGVAAWPNGNSAPSSTLSGGATGLGAPFGLLLDSSNHIVVANLAVPSITAYPVPWVDGAAPLDALRFSDLGTSYLGGIAQDSSGRLYVATSFGQKIIVFGADWINGSHTPVKVLEGAATGLSDPTGIAFDSSGLMYVANRGSNSVTAYAADWANGNTAPIKTLQGPATGLVVPQSVAFSPDGLMMVANYSGGNVTAYSSNWVSGNTSPLKATGVPVQTFSPASIVFDADGRMSVSDWELDRVVTFSPGWSDGATPWRELVGDSTGLDAPGGMAMGPTGDLFVANYNVNTITRYPAIPRVPGVPTAVRATAGPSGSATITWVAPTISGGSTISGYTVVPSSGSSQCTWALGEGPLTCTITGLRLGASYTFTVIATNSEGDSDPSRASRAIVPLPASPTVAKVRPSSIPAGAARTLTISGSGFMARHMTVTIRSVGRKFPCTKVAVASPTSLTCAAPSLGVGSYAVTVGFSDFDVAGGTKVNALQVVRAPSR